jgi:Mrp family chromosome partitioning ATPase
MIRFTKKKKQSPPKKVPPPDNIAGEATDLAQILQTSKKRPKTVLLAAERLSDLPVTVAVNLGIHLAQTQMCLLIDLDIKRDSVATAFQIDSSSIDLNLKLSPVPTAFENLSVWPAQFFDLIRQMNLKSLLESAREKYDYVLLYAPYLPALTDRKQIASLSKEAIIFVREKDKNSTLQQLLSNCNCRGLCEA